MHTKTDFVQGPAALTIIKNNKKKDLRFFKKVENP